MDSTITISQRGEERIRDGHFWVYRSDIAGGRASPGDVVRVVGPRGRYLARALFSDRSQITLRVLTAEVVAIDRNFWRRRLGEAIAFLDQRENRRAAAQYVHGRVLDCFSYAGGFALQLAARASELTALDISEEASAMLARNAARNGLANVSVRTTNVFDELRTLERMGEQFDAIVLDPPAFAKSKDAIPKAISGYKEIDRKSTRLNSSH